MATEGYQWRWKKYFIKNLDGLYNKRCGEIKWNDIPIDSLLNKSICGYLAQTPSLLYGTLSFNITLNENCPKAELAMFSHCFELSPFIAKFKNGWNTLFTAEQDELSFGEVKLIAILRELYKKPKLLILDEPTASLSIEATDYMIALLQKIKSRTTILCVSHETKLLACADEIMLME
jgi:ATP-binding cassette subfamily B protein